MAATFSMRKNCLLFSACLVKPKTGELEADAVNFFREFEGVLPGKLVATCSKRVQSLLLQGAVLNYRGFGAWEGDALTRLIDMKEVSRISVGMAIAMSLSSLILWKSSWLVSSIQSVYGSHGASVLIGALVCFAAFVWSYASPATLRVLLEKVYPPIMAASLLCSYLFDMPGFELLQLFVCFVIPVAGTYLFIFSWFFLLATQSIENGLSSILLSWVLTVALRAFFEFFDGGTAKLLISAALVCATWGLQVFQSRRVGANLPMIVNRPNENRASYVHALRSIWKCVLYCGAFAFLGGVIRSLSLQSDAMMYINYASVLGGLLSALVLAALWRFRTIRYSVNYLFRAVFPLLVLVLCVLPFAGMESFAVFAAVLYIMYSFMTLSLQVLCVQTSHDFGVNPVFCISFQIGISLVMQGIGYLLGNAVNIAFLSCISPLASISLVSIAMLALVLYFTRGLSISQEEEGRDIEFLSLSRKPLQYASSGATLSGGSESDPVDSDASLSRDSVRHSDRLDMRCDLIGKKYYLSQREMEIMKLFARGYTMASIAEELFISENTVKTHMRRLYAKLGIHKKQELFNMVNSYVA